MRLTLFIQAGSVKIKEQIRVFPMKNVAGGVACTALLLLFASPAQAALLQLECSFKKKWGAVQTDGSMLKPFRLNFSLDTETRKGSLTDEKGTIYDVVTRFTGDKIIIKRTDFFMKVRDGFIGTTSAVLTDRF